MSGGVDSAVAAGLLTVWGADAVGATLKVYCYGDRDPSPRGCCSLEDIQVARRSALRLGIGHMVLNLEGSFRETVIDDFIQEYASARTPNPCVRCNTFVKFGTLLHRLPELGLQRVATGHYVRKVRAKDDTGEPKWLLARGRDRAKDQSYVLWGLQSDLLHRFVFPVGGLEKQQVRRLAREMSLPVAGKPESQDICFVGEGHYSDFLQEEAGGSLPLSRPGPIRMRDGMLLGLHRGLIRYTVGQRRGLGVPSPMGEPLYVVSLEPETNTLWVGGRGELQAWGLTADSANLFVSPDDLMDEGLSVQVRAHHRPVPVKEVQLLSDGYFRVDFREPIEGVSPGQSSVLYKDDLMMAGGRIVQTYGSRNAAPRKASRGATVATPAKGDSTKDSGLG
jgi:tRNA-specific 2-thiouridylase